MWSIGVHSDTEFGATPLYSAYTPSNKDIIDTQAFVGICMLFFHFGALIAANRKKEGSHYVFLERRSNNLRFLRSLRTVSKIVLLFEVPLAIGYSLYQFKIAREYGYISLYYGDYQTQGGYIPIMLNAFFPALVGYLIGSGYSRKSQIIAYTIFVAYVIINALSGERGCWVYSMTILSWLHLQYNKISLTKTKIVFIGIIAICALFILQAFVLVRDIGLENIMVADLFDIMTIGDFPLFNLFFELGGTMSIIMYLLHTGNAIYPYPNTYIVAILGCISTGVINLFGIKQVLLSDWFSQDHLGLHYGAGFSMIGEAYINGGYVGSLIYLAILGFLLSKLIGSGRCLKNDPLRLFVAVAGLNSVIGLIRGALYLSLKNFVWGVAFFVLLVWIHSIFSNRTLSVQAFSGSKS